MINGLVQVKVIHMFTVLYKKLMNISQFVVDAFTAKIVHLQGMVKNVVVVSLLFCFLAVCFYSIL